MPSTRKISNGKILYDGSHMHKSKLVRIGRADDKEARSYRWWCVDSNQVSNPSRHRPRRNTKLGTIGWDDEGLPDSNPSSQRAFTLLHLQNEGSERLRLQEDLCTLSLIYIQLLPSPVTMMHVPMRRRAPQSRTKVLKPRCPEHLNPHRNRKSCRPAAESF